jgi:hypothetical protein
VAHTCHNGLTALGGLRAAAALPAWPLRGAAVALVVGALALASSGRRGEQGGAGTSGPP